MAEQRQSEKAGRGDILPKLNSLFGTRVEERARQQAKPKSAIAAHRVLNANSTSRPPSSVKIANRSSRPLTPWACI
ncbi:MAG TPA: hypothetical protein VGG86_12195 [Roseiarcus sp.]